MSGEAAIPAGHSLCVQEDSDEDVSIVWKPDHCPLDVERKQCCPSGDFSLTRFKSRLRVDYHEHRV